MAATLHWTEMAPGTKALMDDLREVEALVLNAAGTVVGAVEAERVIVTA